MNTLQLRNIRDVIYDRKHGKHIYMDNRLIMNGRSNLDEIEVDFDAFFSSYENNKENSKQV